MHNESNTWFHLPEGLVIFYIFVILLIIMVDLMQQIQIEWKKRHKQNMDNKLIC